MVISAEHPYTKYFTLWLDGEQITQYFQYDTVGKIASVVKEETGKLFAWDFARLNRTGIEISEEYEIRGSLFVRDVAGDFEVRVNRGCPPRVSDEILKWSGSELPRQISDHPPRGDTSGRENDGVVPGAVAVPL